MSAGTGPGRSPTRCRYNTFRSGTYQTAPPKQHSVSPLPAVQRVRCRHVRSTSMTPRSQPSANTAANGANQHYSEDAEPSKETMTNQQNSGSEPAAQDMSPEEIQAVIDRILAKDIPARNAAAADGGRADSKGVLGKAQAISQLSEEHSAFDGDQQDLEERRALRRTAGLSTELEDVTEVEYRQLRLERVVLAGLWTEGTAADAQRSLAELAALAETAGSQVLDALIQRR